MEEDDNIFKITCQSYNGFVTCKVRIVEMLYIPFIHYRLCTIALYPKDIDPEFFYFQCPFRTKK